VGVILYEMLVGQPPFFAQTPEETQFKVNCLTFKNGRVCPGNSRVPTPEPINQSIRKTLKLIKIS
jgi:hypothetical protein